MGVLVLLSPATSLVQVRWCCASNPLTVRLLGVVVRGTVITEQAGADWLSHPSRLGVLALPRQPSDTRLA